MKKILTICSLMAFTTVIFAATGSFQPTIMKSEEGKVVLKDHRGLIHNLEVREIDGNRTTVDYIHYNFIEPEVPEDYGDFLAGYQTGGGFDFGDTVINWFSLIAPGTVTTLEMQNMTSGNANMFFAGPAMIFDAEEDGWFYNMPDRYEDFTSDMLMIPFVTPVECTSHDPNDQFDDFGNWDPRWNTFDLTAMGFEFMVEPTDVSGHDLTDFWGVPEIWAGYETDPGSDYGPRMWQDGLSQLQSETNGVHSFSTLHEYSGPVGAYYYIWTGNDDSYFHLMRMTASYENVPPVFSSMSTASDGWTSYAEISVDVTDIDGTVTLVEAYYYVNEGEAVMLGEDTEAPYEFVIPDNVAGSGDVVGYFFYAEDDTDLFSTSTAREFAIVAKPTEETVLLITENDGGVDSSFHSWLGADAYWWDTGNHNGIPADMLDPVAVADWDIVIFAGWGVELFPMTAGDGYEDILGLDAYISNGGFAVYSDQDYFWGHCNDCTNMTFMAGDFAYDVFGLGGGYSDPADDVGGIGDLTHYGMEGNSFTGSFVDAVYGPLDMDGWGWTNWGDYVTPNENADLIFVGASSGEGSGVYHSYGDGGTLFFSVNIELGPQAHVEQLFGDILDALACTPGDVNDDGGYSVLDVLKVVNFILGTLVPDAQEACAADYNGDGNMNVMDVVGLVNLILNPTGRVINPATEAVITVSGNTATISANGAIGGLQFGTTTDIVLNGNDELAADNGMVVIWSMNGVLETTTMTFFGEVSLENLIVASSDGREVEVSILTANDFSLSQNFPNPFNPNTTISYSIAEDANVSLSIYNVMGQRVIDLVNAPQYRGSYSVEWNGMSLAGESVSSGVYFYKMDAGDFSETKKMFFLK